ncbi:iron complex outermembrane receptor protein [Novosphingobium chloroacetimidivorans]|uniref:Iron complex outermembrane receptor protein n=1 Tax=Novosphingobium chloroacetimidivorans TaxID=1428314 RepID=A0A7W7KDG0_9SPHN|nr:TonB-dependent receptor [Novosphingobium chloroacetimidivorans]MBB4860218.1 iron complex outermembrane receptor protein [Novosphingobium chloroacetimidivorans]
MTDRIWKTALGAGVAMSSLAVSMPAMAQDAGGDIVVTARRTEERLQDVPISITVFNQDQLQKRNVAVASDLAVYTPSLQVNTRFGPEKATFAIRGFNQDAASAPTVGVYFADVVGVRAQGGTAGGNTVGAGAFTDLQNVQVLKGPQGTLFGRNTTGGAVLIVPTKPTDNLEGYVEGTYGNFDQKRVQAALNIPLADTFKVRFAVDRNKRDGYVRNRSGIGPKDYNDVNYGYYRLSVLAELTPELENYTVASYSRSRTNGYANKIEQCAADAAAPFNPVTGAPNIDPATGQAAASSRYYIAQAACDQIARQNARGDGALDVEVSNPNPGVAIDIWQVINTTTWQASDTLTIKNIASYGEYRERSAFNLESDNFFISDNPITRAYALRGGPRPGTPFKAIQLANQPGYDAAAGSTTTEELQVQGRSADGKLNFVIGGYLEFSRPLGYNQQRTGIFGNCADPGTLQCAGAVQLVPIGPALLPGAIVSESRTKYSFDNHGVFAQGTYNFTDKFGVTLGGRWTFDKIVGYAENNRYVFGTLPGIGTIPLQRVCNDNLNHPAPGAPNATPTNTVNLLTNGGNTGACGTTIVNKSNKPTWLIDFDFKPTPDTLIYAKYARGYRQGAINFTNPGIETVAPEKLEAYEIGAKLSFRGSVPGYLNVAAFYNDFSNQQIFGSLVPKANSGLSGGAALINAGKSTLKGIEADAGVTAFNVLRLGASYTYLDTKLKEITVPALDPASPFAQIIPLGNVGGPLTYSPKHRLTVSGDIMVPVDDSLGEVTLGAVFTYTSSQAVSQNVSIAGYSLLNLNAAWNNIGGSGIDLAAFATNITDKRYRSNYGNGFESFGLRDFSYGQPRMYGLRVRYNFGS